VGKRSGLQDLDQLGIGLLAVISRHLGVGSWGCEGARYVVRLGDARRERAVGLKVGKGRKDITGD
jgi:hypothetical protein